jgi:hypothetical protein
MFFYLMTGERVVFIIGIYCFCYGGCSQLFVTYKALRKKIVPLILITAGFICINQVLHF